MASPGSRRLDRSWRDCSRGGSRAPAGSQSRTCYRESNGKSPVDRGFRASGTGDPRFSPHARVRLLFGGSNRHRRTDTGSLSCLGGNSREPARLLSGSAPRFPPTSDEWPVSPGKRSRLPEFQTGKRNTEASLSCGVPASTPSFSNFHRSRESSCSSRRHRMRSMECPIRSDVLLVGPEFRLPPITTRIIRHLRTVENGYFTRLSGRKILGI